MRSKSPTIGRPLPSAIASTLALPVVVLVLVLVLAPHVASAGDAPPTPAATPEPRELPARGARAYVGVDVRAVRDLDLGAGTFVADLDLSVRWRGSGDPTGIAPANGTLTSREEVARADDGPWHHVRWRASGRFHAGFDAGRFPFDAHRLPIEIAHPALGSDALMLRADPEGSRVASRVASQGSPDPEGSGDIEGSRAAPGLVAPGLDGFLVRPTIRVEHDLVPAAPGGGEGALFGDTAGALRSRLRFSIDIERRPGPVLARVGAPLCAALALALAAAVARRQGRRRAARALALGALAAALGAPLVFLALRPAHRTQAGASTAAFDSGRSARDTPPAARLRSVRPELTIGLLREPTRLFAGRITISDNLVTGLLVEPPVELDNRLNLVPRLVAEEPSAGRWGGGFLLRGEEPGAQGGATSAGASGRWVVRWRLLPGRHGDGTPIALEDAVAAQALRPIPGAFVRIDGDSIAVEYERPRAGALLDLALFPNGRIAQFSSVSGRARFGTAEVPALTGPFVLSAWRPGEELVLTRNPWFHRGPAALERVRVRIFPTRERLADAFVEGAVHLVPEGIFEPAAAASIAARLPGAEARRSMAPNWWHLDVNHDDPRLADRRVRQALLHAIDREGLVRDVLGGHGRVSHSWLHPQHEGYLADIRRRPFDLEEAARLLDEAGLRAGPDGRRRAPGGPPLALEVARAEQHPAAVAASLARTLGSLGIEVVDRAYPDATYFRETLAHRRFRHMALYMYTFDPTETGRDTWSMDRIPGWDNAWKGKNWTGWRSPEATALHERIDAAFFEEDRIELYERQQRLWAEEVPALPLYRREQALLVAPGLAGVVQHAGGDYHLPWNAEEWHFVK